MNDIKGIKKLLADYELAYNDSDWLRLERALQRRQRFARRCKIAAIASLSAIVALSVYLLSTQNVGNNVPASNAATVDIVAPEPHEAVPDNVSHADAIATEHAVTTPIDNVQSAEPKPAALSQAATTAAASSSTLPPAAEIATVPQNDVAAPAALPTVSDPANEPAAVNVPTAAAAEPTPQFVVHHDAVCVPATVTFEATNVAPGCQIEWETGSGDKLTGSQVDYVYEHAGTFTPKVHVVKDAAVVKTTALTPIEFKKARKVTITVDNSGNMFYFACEASDDMTYSWTINGNVLTDNELRYEFRRPGSYPVSLVATDADGCTAQASVTVDVKTDNVYYLPTAFRPDQNGINARFGAIGENMNFTFFKMTIVDINGKVVFVSNNVDQKWNGNINNNGSEAPAGCYLWEITTVDKYGNKEQKTGKVNLIRN